MLVAFVMAMSCGGNDSATGTSYGIAGAIDAGVVGTDTSNLVVYAIDTSDTTKSFKGTITTGTSGEDHTYSVTGLEGTEYSIVVSREYQGSNPFEKSKAELVSSVVTATASTGTLAKPARFKRKYKRQCNMASSYISRKYRKAKKSGATTTLTSIVETTFGTGVNLEEIVSDGGKLSVGGTSIVYKDPIAKIAVTQLTFATVAAVTMSESSVLSLASSLETFADSMSSATATDIASVLSTQSTTFSTLITSADSTSFASLASTADSVASTFLSGSTTLIAALTTVTVTTLIETSFAIATTEATLAGVSLDSSYITTLATTSTTITTTTITTSSTTLVTSLGTSAGLTDAQVASTTTAIATATTTTVTVSLFDLADSTYGTKSGSNFTLYSLAPVFKVTLASAVTGITKIEDLVKLTLTHGSTSSVVSSSNAKSWTADGLTYYIHVFNSSAVAAVSGSELRAGETYTYAIASADTSKYTLSSTSTSGTVTVADITFTLPFDGSSNNSSQVALGTSTTYNGLSASSALTFVVNSASSVTYSTTDTDIIGATGLITSLTRGGSAVTGAIVSAASETSGTISVTITQGTSTKTGITITDIVAGTGSSTGTGFKLNIPTGFIQAGTNSITIAKGDRAANRSMPTTLNVTGK